MEKYAKCQRGQSRWTISGK